MELKKYTVYCDRCIFCQKPTILNLVSTEDGREKIREAATIRRDEEVLSRIGKIGQEFKYHMTNLCYKNYTHPNQLKKFKIQVPDQADIDSSIQPSPKPKRTSRRRKNCTATKNVCVLCSQIKMKNISRTCRICEVDCAIQFLEATRYFQDDVFSRTSHLTDIPSVYAADVYYHKVCMRKYLRRYERTKCEAERSMDKSIKILAFNDFIEQITPDLRCGKGFDLSQVSEAVGICNKTVKKYLQQKFKDDVYFAKPSQTSLPTMFWLPSAVQPKDMVNLIRSKDLLRDSAKQLKSSFGAVDFGLNGQFCDEQNLKLSWENIKVPDDIVTFLSELFSFNVDEFKNCAEYAETDDESDNFRSKYLKIISVYQIMYYIIHGGKKKTPLHVLNGLAVHHACRSSTLIKSFNHIGVSVGYDDVLRIKNDIASYIVQNCGENVPMPSSFHKEKFTTAAFDNFDHNEATLSGMKSTHDTVLVLFQDESDVMKLKPKISETGVKHGSRSFKIQLPCQQVKDFVPPSKNITLPNDYLVMEYVCGFDPSVNEQKEMLWNLCRMSEFENGLEGIQLISSEQNVPTWAAFNSLVSTEVPSKQIIGYLPIIPYPVTEYSTVYAALVNFENILKQLDQQFLPVACDEGVYRIARHITLAHPDKFKNIILMMGAWHMAKIAMACIGKYLKGSGADIIFIESLVFGPSVTESVLNGTNYVRSFKGLLLLSEALQRLQIVEFLKTLASQKYDEEIDRIKQIQLKFKSNDIEACKTNILNYLQTPSKILFEFKKFVEKRRSESELFLYWDNVIRMISIAKDLVRSDRERKWLLQIDAFDRLQPIFAVFDRTNYIRWSSVYVEDMKALPETAPEVYEEFLDGKFTIKRSDKDFTAVALDMCLEQTINKSKKSSSGIIGKTMKKESVTEWDLTYHEILGISNLYRDKTSGGYNYEMRSHHNLSQSYTTTMEEHLRKITDYITQHENPFSPGSHSLRNIITQQEVDPKVKDELLNVFEIGAKLVETSRKGIFIDKTHKISDVIHKRNFPSFDFKAKTTPSSGKTKHDNVSLGHRIIELARERNFSIEKVFQYELVDNKFLFDEEGYFTKCTKSSLMTEFEKHKEIHITYKTDKMGDIGPASVQVDVLSFLRKIPHVIECATFGNFAAHFCRLINKSIPQKSKRIDFIFDSYFENSPKAFERIRRSANGSVEIFKIQADVKMPIQKDKFWSSSSNKNKLQNFLKKYILEGNDFSTDIHIFCGAIFGNETSPCLSRKYVNGAKEIIEHPELSLEYLEEADVRIMPHINHAVKAGFVQILLISTDTDVSVLSLYHWRTFNQYGLKELWMKIGSGKSIRFIPIHELQKVLGPELCSIIVALHILTGSDVTSKVGTKHAAMMLSDPTKYLSGFGATHECTEIIIQLAEMFLVQLLQKNSNFESMNELRYSIHKKDNNISLNRLPPTSSSIREHVLRAFYNSYLQMNCLSKPLELDLTEFGYEYSGDLIVPKTGINLYPPEDELVPPCTDGKCTRKTCKCASAGIRCCIYCKCQNTDEMLCYNPHSQEDCEV